MYRADENLQHVKPLKDCLPVLHQSTVHFHIDDDHVLVLQSSWGTLFLT